MSASNRVDPVNPWRSGPFAPLIARGLELGRPIVRLDDGGRRLLPLEGELCLRDLRHRGRLLEPRSIDVRQDAAHPVKQLVTRRTGSTGTHRIAGLTRLCFGDGLLLLHDLCTVLRERHFLTADLRILRGDRALQRPFINPRSKLAWRELNWMSASRAAAPECASQADAASPTTMLPPRQRP